MLVHVAWLRRRVDSPRDAGEIGGTLLPDVIGPDTRVLIVRLLYRPFGIVFGLVGGAVARRVFNAVWSRVDDREPPSPTTRDTSVARLLGAEGLRAATFAMTRAAFDRAGARVFYGLSGRWPGDRSERRP